MITAAQLRAARGLLDWTRADLAKAANISPETVKNIEHGTFRPQENTADAIVKAFAGHDVQFTENEGVQKQKRLVTIFTRERGFHDYLDHAYSVARQGNLTTRHFNFSDVNFGLLPADVLEAHNKRMSAIANLDARCLVPYGDRNFPAKYCQYRWLKKEHQNALPYYNYGDFVLFFMQPEPEFMIASIYSKALSESLRRQFDVFWNESITPEQDFTRGAAV